MNKKLFWGVLLAASMSVPALADDPQDPAMRSGAARARDHEQTRQLNLREGDKVRERDAGYARGWAAVRAARGGAPGERDSRQRLYERQMADYARANARYEQQMAEWHSAVVDGPGVR